MIDNVTKLSLVKSILSRTDFLGKYFDNELLFLEKIWPLRAMPSQDGRYTNAYDDIYQHTVNNNDWDKDILYFTRLKLIDGDESYFILFLENVVHPETRSSQQDIQEFVALINSALTSEDVKLFISSYFDGLPVYTIQNKRTGSDLSLIISLNQIPFFKAFDRIDEYPCFLLEHSSWDDYHHRTSMMLRSIEHSGGAANYIGLVKIMKKDTQKTWDTLPDKFTSLSSEYCSLGQDDQYYSNFKELLPQKYQAALLAIRDAALFTNIAEEFENDSIFKTSLIRDNSAEELFRTIKYKLRGTNINEYFKFNFSFKPPFSEETVNFYFNFEYGKSIDHRIIALIGKNGTGKTSMLSSLINSFSKQTVSSNVNMLPLFGKYFTVSYSIFDRFSVPEPNDAFNYVYCGLRNVDRTLLTEALQLEQFYNAAVIIKERDLTLEWYGILSGFLSTSHLKLIFPSSEWELEHSQVTFSKDNFDKIKHHFSSGESILIFILTRIISEIRTNSLILYDEPETHLHPNAVSTLMNSIFKLVKTFNSFCIIATHSPLVIRELYSRDVLVLKREYDSLEIQRLERESFGENLTVITEEIFGNREVEDKHYLNEIKRIMETTESVEGAVRLIQNESIPVSLSTRLYLNSIMKERNEES